MPSHPEPSQTPSPIQWISTWEIVELGGHTIVAYDWSAVDDIRGETYTVPGDFIGGNTFKDLKDGTILPEQRRGNHAHPNHVERLYAPSSLDMRASLNGLSDYAASSTPRAIGL
jgi:hypothetical protein